MGPLAIGMFRDGNGTFSNRMFSDGMLSDGTFCIKTFLHIINKGIFVNLSPKYAVTCPFISPPCSFNEFLRIFKQSTYIILTAYYEIHLYIFGVQPCCCQPRSSAASCLDTKSAPFCGADPGLRRVTICYTCLGTKSAPSVELIPDSEG